MNSLVLELQSEALDPSSSVLNLLRKASLIAYKLNVQELHKWVQLELNGYSKSSQLPDYRFVNGELKAQNPFHGLIPVMMDSAKISDLISKRPVCESINELEYLVSNNNKKFLYLLLPKELELTIQSWSRDPLPLLVRVPTSQFNRILEHTRDIILNWSLRLEKDGILGEGMTFSTQEKEVANHDRSPSTQIAPKPHLID
jgi:AbiTii